MKTFLLPVAGILLALCLCASANSVLDSNPLIKEWLMEMRGETGAPTADTFITIKNGTIKGNTAISVGLHTIYQYLGVPYAKPPVGDLRFEPPQPHDGWGDEILEATKQPHACPQYLTNFTEADENCLFLSIYSRQQGNNSGKLLPVIYFVHGGGFALGQSSTYTGVKLLAEEVVLVTVQYRLGPLGFLATGDTSVSANNAMKDMVLGLRWVQENIEAFGGDPNQVTIMGESAGSASVLYLLISPLAKGLFHQVIAMSGSPLQEWAIDRNPAETLHRLGELLNCTTTSTAAIVACLKVMDWMPLVRGGLGLILEDFTDFRMVLSGASVVIEGDIPGAFLPDDPLKLMLEGDIPNVRLMLGTVQHEGALPLAGAHYLKLGPENLTDDTEAARLYTRDYLVGDLLKTYGVHERENGASVSLAMGVGYFHAGSSRDNFTEIQYELMDLLSAVFMKGPVLRTADILSRRLPAVYLYSFEHYSTNVLNSLYHLAFTVIIPIIGGQKPPIRPGIMHADDLIYMFNFPFILTANDIAFSRIYCKLFTNFVVSGEPAPEESDLYPVWPPYNTDTQKYMELTLPPVVKTDYTSSWRKGMPGNVPV